MKKERKDPVLDSDAFREALTYVLLEDRDGYNILVKFLFYGMRVEAIAKEQNIARSNVYKKLTRAKDILRKNLETKRPDLLSLSALIAKEVEDLTRRETEEINSRFPFVDPHKL